MKTKLLASLEEAILNWSETAAETDDWPEFYFHTELPKQMAAAASLVMDASVDGQAFADKERE